MVNEYKLGIKEGFRLKRFTSLVTQVVVMACILAIIPKPVNSAVNVYLTPASPASLQADFIANATTQYNATLVASPYFPGTFTLNLISKKVVAPPTTQLPCDLDKNLALLVANSTKTYDYGFSAGMDSERYQDVQWLYGMQGQDYIAGTCAGMPMVATSTTSCENACLSAYNVIVSTIQQRWGYVFDATGNVVQR